MEAFVSFVKIMNHFYLICAFAHSTSTISLYEMSLRGNQRGSFINSNLKQSAFATHDDTLNQFSIRTFLESTLIFDAIEIVWLSRSMRLRRRGSGARRRP